MNKSYFFKHLSLSMISDSLPYDSLPYDSLPYDSLPYDSLSYNLQSYDNSLPSLTFPYHRTVSRFYPERNSQQELNMEPKSCFQCSPCFLNGFIEENFELNFSFELDFSFYHLEIYHQICGLLEEDILEEDNTLNIEH